MHGLGSVPTSVQMVGRNDIRQLSPMVNNGCVVAWVHGDMGVWVHGCMGAWVHGCMGAECIIQCAPETCSLVSQGWVHGSWVMGYIGVL